MARTFALFAAAALAVLVLDQLTKYLVLGELTTAYEGAASPLAVFYGEPPPPGPDGAHFRPRTHVVFHPDFFRFRYAENEGAAFGLFRSLPAGLRGPLFHLVSLGAVLLVLSYLVKLTGARDERWARLGLPLVLGGALGNYVDRLARGFVIDFIEAHWLDVAYWPAFNVADTAIVVGVGFLTIDSFVRKEKKAFSTRAAA